MTTPSPVVGALWVNTSTLPCKKCAEFLAAIKARNPNLVIKVSSAEEKVYDYVCTFANKTGALLGMCSLISSKGPRLAHHTTHFVL